jgi:Ulp1 family protease
VAHHVHRSGWPRNFAGALDVPRGLWLVPAHQSYHWQLIAITNASTTPSVYVLDSLAPLGAPRNLRQLKRFAAELIIRVFPHISRHAITYVSTRVPQQPNSNDCGVYMLKFMSLLAIDPHLQDLSSLKRR